MEAKLYGQNKGGMSINGIIKDYYAYAGENISAGDLVEYVNGVAGKVDYGESVDTQLSTEANSGYTISAVQLDESRVFIAHSYGSNYHLYGVVCKIDGAIITYGADTQIYAIGNGGLAISTCLLPNGNVFIAHSYGANKNLYGIVCSIDGITITKGGDTALSSTNLSGYEISTCLLPNGNVFIAHSYNDSTYLYGMVVSIDGTTITKGTDTALVSSAYAGHTISTCLLPNGNVFIAHSYSSSYHLYGIVCSISGTTITKGSDTAISATNNAGDVFSLVKLDDTRVFMSFRDSGNVILQAIVCTISGTSISKGTITDLSSVSHTAGGKLENLLLPNGDVLIIHSSGSNYSIAGMICNINGTAITAGTDVELISLQTSARQLDALLLGDIVFIAHINNNTNYYLYAQIFGIDYDNNIPTNNIVTTEYETQVRKVTTGQFDGVAKTSGEGSPEFVEGEVKKTGNIFPVSGWNEEVAYTKYSANGYVIESDSAYSNQYPVKNAFDNSTSGNSYWRPAQGATGSIQITCPEPIKITKMKTFVCDDYSGSYFDNAVIQGKVTDGEWVNLYTISTNQTSLTEITLNNTDFYNDYKMTVTIQSSAREIRVPEWQTSEYIEKGLVPSTGHKDIVSIWTKE